jgi:hypothetical protein
LLYLLLPIKALFDLKPQRELVKLVYGRQNIDEVWGTAYFDSETGLCLFNLRLTLFNTVWFILSEINYNFANQTAFTEDSGPHTGFRSNVIKTKSALYASHMVEIQSSVESRYGGTVQMWVSTQAGGASGYYLPVKENYIFFGSEPILKRKLMSTTPHYPPEQWNAYGQYLWWWIPAEALADATINIFNVSMTRTSVAPYTFTATQSQTGLYFSEIVFDNDGYMTSFSAKDPSIGLNLDLGSLIDNNTTVDGLAYYRNNMGTAAPEIPIIQATQSMLNFGYVPPGSYKDLTMEVKNIGLGTLIGMVSASSPFSVVSGGSYSLGANLSQQVVVRYTAPLQKESRTGSLIFTGGGGLTIQLKGTNKNVGLSWFQLFFGN